MEKTSKKDFEYNTGIIGIGSAGANIAHLCKEKGIHNAKTIAIGNDIEHIRVDEKLDTKDIMNIKEFLKNKNIVFVCAGLGGKTGTQMAPIVVTIAQTMNCKVFGMFTLPLDIERERVRNAEFCLLQLKQTCDALITFDNNAESKDIPVHMLFSNVNKKIFTTIKEISESITIPAMVNLDFDDITEIFRSGKATIRTAEAEGEDRKNKIIQKLFPKEKSNALLVITGDKNLTLDEVSEIGENLAYNLNDNSNLIWCAKIDDNLKDKVKVNLYLSEAQSV